MSTRVDQTSAVESRRAQLTGASTSPAATTSGSRISMFGAKSGFVIPKNKLSGSMVPVIRGGKKLGSNDGVNEESSKMVQRKTKWGPDLTQDAAVRRGLALAYQVFFGALSELCSLTFMVYLIPWRDFNFIN